VRLCVPVIELMLINEKVMKSGSVKKHVPSWNPGAEINSDIPLIFIFDEFQSGTTGLQPGQLNHQKQRTQNRGKKLDHKQPNSFQPGKIPILALLSHRYPDGLTRWRVKTFKIGNR
jgi:hypothetical protein